MNKIKTPFPDVWIIEPDVFKDKRGFFLESYSYKKYKNLGIKAKFIQDNHAKSQKNTLRGIHFSIYPGQVKLVRCTQGAIWDVIVDLRQESPTFKNWHGVELSEENFKQLFIPVGFGHGYAVLSETAEVQYKVSNYYDPEIESEVAWNDPSVGIDWKIKDPILSERDQTAPRIDEFFKENPSPFKPPETPT